MKILASRLYFLNARCSVNVAKRIKSNLAYSQIRSQKSSKQGADRGFRRLCIYKLFFRIIKMVRYVKGLIYLIRLATFSLKPCVWHEL